MRRERNTKFSTSGVKSQWECKDSSNPRADLALRYASVRQDSALSGLAAVPAVLVVDPGDLGLVVRRVGQAPCKTHLRITLIVEIPGVLVEDSADLNNLLIVATCSQ